MAAETNGETVWKRNESASDHEEVWDDSALIEAYDRAVNQVKEEIAQRNSGSGSFKKKDKNRKPKGNQAITWKVGDYCQAVFSEDGVLYEAFVKEVNQSGTSCLVQYIGYGNEEIVSLSELSPSLGKEARKQQEANAGNNSQFVPKNEVTSETNSQQSVPQSKGRSERFNWKKPRSSSGGVSGQPNQASQQSVSQSKRNWRKPRTSSGGAPAQANQASCSNSIPGPPDRLLSWLKSVVPPQANLDNKAQPYTCGCMYSGHSCQNNQPSFHPMQHHIPPPPFPLDHDVVDNEEALAAMLMSWYMSGYHTGFYQALQQSRSCKTGPVPCCLHSAK